MSFEDEVAIVQTAVIDTFRETEPVTIYPVDDPWTPVLAPAVFDDEAAWTLYGEEVIETSSTPILSLRDSDHRGKRGDELVVVNKRHPNGKRFRAVDVRPDGRGFSVLLLEAVA